MLNNNKETIINFQSNFQYHFSSFVCTWQQITSQQGFDIFRDAFWKIKRDENSLKIKNNNDIVKGLNGNNKLEISCEIKTPYLGVIGILI